MGPRSEDQAFLPVSDRIAIVNALMAQDRQEVRNHQDSLLKLSYLMVPAFVGVAAFYDTHRSLQFVLIIGQLLLLLLYIVVFLVTALKWLRDARACLTIREQFYANRQKRLFQNPFVPLRPIEQDDYENSLVDRYIWFPFCVTVIAAAVTLLFMVL